MARAVLVRALPGIALLAGVTAFAAVAHAERVRTTDTVKLYRDSGEQSGVITKIAEGTTLTVLRTDGRWLKVRVNGRTGWITRSNVQSLDGDDDVPRNTRRRPFVDGRSTRRGWGEGAPEDRVGADAVGGDGGGDDGHADDGDHRRGDDGDDGQADDGDDDRRADDGDDDRRADDGDDGADQTVAMVVVTAGKTKLYPRASRKAKASRTLKRGARLTVLERDDEWVRVEYGDDAGFVRADDVADADAGPPRPARAISAKARLGFASLGGSFASNGPATATNPPSNYALGSTAVSLDIGVDVAWAYKRDYFLGVGVEYLGCVATPGIRYASQDIGFKTHDVDLRVLGGYDLHDKRGTVLWGRLGYHVGITSMSDLNNMAQLPSETFRGPAIGAAMTMPRLTPTIGVGASLDLVYPGTRSQTQGNEDGTLDGAMGVAVGVAGAYAWRPAWNLEAAYRFGYAKSAWKGASNRVTGATAAERVDKNHVLTVGLARVF